MTSITGVPTTRVSDQFIRSRMLSQVQFDQSELYRLQMQLSTGRRFEVPGEDPVAAGRVMSLQSLLERKEQVQANLVTNQSYLTSSDVAMSRISDLVNEVRGAALAVIGTTSSDEQRNAVSLQVEQAARQLLDAGNQKFRGRYLFAGSTTQTRPFEMVGNNTVRYNGNENELLSFSDIDLLFATNVNGNDVFGAVSEPIRGSIDFDPVLSANTRLDDLRQGQAISAGSIAVSDASGTTIVDISSAETIGDVAMLIRNNPPPGRSIDVEISPTGLRLVLDGQETPAVREVAGGTTAGELGILNELAGGSGALVGQDLDPILRKTTRLDDILGARARAVVMSGGMDNDIVIEADVRGDALNGITIHFNDDPAVTFGNEVVTYDPATRRINIGIDENLTQAQHVVDAINDRHDLVGDIPFRARLDPLDEGASPGTGLIPGTPVGQAAGTTTHGAPVEFDQDSGIQIVNGGSTYVIDISSAQTIEDMLNIFNGSDAGVMAEINADKTGINVRSRLSGSDFAIGENGGQTASQLGIRSLTTSTKLDDMNFGLGVMDYQGIGIAAVATFSSVGVNSDVVFRARVNGSEWNDFTIDIVDSGGGAGSETVVWDPIAKSITVSVVPGITTAERLVEVFEESPGPRDSFEIYLDDDDGQPNRGTGLVYTGSVTTGGGNSGGTDFSITRADDVVLDVDLNGAESVADVLNAINTHADNADGFLVAQLAAFGNGIELVDNTMGAGQLSVSRTALSTTAIDLGLVAQGMTVTTPTDAGSVATVGVASAGLNNDLIFQGANVGAFPNGVEVVFVDTGAEAISYNQISNVLRFDIDTAGGTDANRIIQLLNDDPIAARVFSVQLDPTDGNDGTGVVQATNPASPRILSGGTPSAITGTDQNPLEAEGLFTGLLRLQSALRTNDNVQIQRAIEVLDKAAVNMNYTRADMGAKQQGLDVLKDRLEAEEIDLREVLSMEHDIDIVEVISNLTARQMALEAGMRAAAAMFQMTLLNYL
jgi:flagellar hook-associated protein 3 FlgL